MAMHNLRPASKKYTLRKGETSRQLATSAVIVRGAIVTGGGSSIVLRIFDSRNGSEEAGPAPHNYMIAANTGESTVSQIQHTMDKGLYIEIEQGDAFNGEATIFYD